MKRILSATVTCPYCNDDLILEDGNVLVWCEHFDHDTYNTKGAIAFDTSVEDQEREWERQQSQYPHPRHNPDAFFKAMRGDD